MYKQGSSPVETFYLFKSFRPEKENEDEYEFC